jgi:dephospho-CoA kinase
MSAVSPPLRRTRVLGVLGGIASGKSEVARLLAGADGVVLDADRIAHAALESPELRAWLADRFGPALVAGERVDRAALGALVFPDPAARAELEARVHPLVRATLREGVAAARARGVPWVVLDVPLLLENEAAHHLPELCDALVFVDADAKVREERARARRGWAAPELARREALQLPLEAKRARADFVLANDGDLSELRAAVERVRATLGAS